LVEYFFLYIKGVYKGKLTAKRIIKIGFIKFFNFIKEIFAHPISTLCLLLGMASATYVRSYMAWTTMYFGAPDVYVHADWVNQTIGGNIFADGVYPFGMHNIITALNLVFGINVTTLMRFFGCYFGMILVLAIYLLLSKTFKSRAATCVGFMFYSICGLIPTFTYYRQCFALPQEAGMIFLFPCAVFFNEYLKTKGLRHLVFFGMAMTMATACHFYITIFAAVMCLIIFLVNIVQILKEKLFSKIFLAVLLSIVLSIGPLVGANLMGIPWQGTMQWALGVLHVGTTQQTPAPESIGMDVQTGTAANDTQTNDLSVNNPTAKVDPVTAVKDLIVYVGETFGFEQSNTPADRLKSFVIFLTLTIIMVLFGIAIFIFKRDNYSKFLISLGLYALANILLIVLYKMKIISFMEEFRMWIFYSYNFGFLIGAAVEIILYPLVSFKPMKYVHLLASVAIIGVFMYFLSATGIQSKCGYSQVQYDSAIRAYYRIVNEYEQNKWTIVSPVDELSMIRNLGWHYELCDLIYDLSETDTGKKINLPSDDVFFFIEKRPIGPYRFKGDDTPWPPELPISKEDAQRNITQIRSNLNLLSDIYTNYSYRRVIMAKAFYWMEEYRRYFKTEITVFYEDEDLVVYHLKQLDPYALNNLYIDYGYNQ